MLDTSLTGEQQAWVASVGSAISLNEDDRPRLETTWARLAELGVFELMLPESVTFTTELLLAMEVIGQAAIAGPFAVTVLAMHALPTEAGSLTSGQRRVGYVDGEVVAWGERDDLLISLGASGNVHVHHHVDNMQSFSTLADSRWHRAACPSASTHVASASSLAIADLVVAAWLVGAGSRLVELGGDHARSRRQFGRALGEFQAVAFSLADASAEIDAARDQVRRVGSEPVEDEHQHRRAALARVAATRAASTCAFVAHQVFGAMGFATETPVGALSTRIREMSMIPPLFGRAHRPSVEQRS